MFGCVWKSCVFPSSWCSIETLEGVWSSEACSTTTWPELWGRDEPIVVLLGTPVHGGVQSESCKVSQFSGSFRMFVFLITSNIRSQAVAWLWSNPWLTLKQPAHGWGAHHVGRTSLIISPPGTLPPPSYVPLLWLTAPPDIYDYFHLKTLPSSCSRQ